MRIRALWLAIVGCVVLGHALPAAAQVDQQRAQAFFTEVQALCERDGGRLWGVSLCGPMVIGDLRTQSFATSQPAPEGARPRVVGLANAPLQWGGATWGCQYRHWPCEHLDALDGRYWLRLEWRALARALQESAAQRNLAVREALAARCVVAGWRRRLRSTDDLATLVMRALAVQQPLTPRRLPPDMAAPRSVRPNSNASNSGRSVLPSCVDGVSTVRCS